MAVTTLHTARTDSAAGILARGAPSKPTLRRIATLPCLLVTRDQVLRAAVTHAGEATGWKVVTHAQPIEAMRAAVLNDFPLSVIDLGATGKRSDGCDSLMESLRGMADGLVIVCEQLRDPAAGGEAPSNELWSRERGAWMYLPNAADADKLELICREARAVIDKLRGPRNEAAHEY